MRVAEFFLGSIPILIQLYVQKYMKDDLENTTTELGNELNVPKTKTYDFIIVGGGTAGCVLAGRLSESFNVLLLEAGGEPPPGAAVPYFYDSVQQDPTINYFFKPIPDANAPFYIDIVLGKMLGGSGSHNSMVHNRGNHHDYDHWAELVNDNSWNYDNVVQYFKKSEKFVGTSYGPKSDVQYYGTDGPITVQQIKNNITESWLQAGRELGYTANDPNAFQTESFTPTNEAVRNGKRSSSYSEYIRPFENTRENLTVIRYANVSEILLDENNRAYGVVFTRHHFPQIAHATKEVILSAGSFSSPLLLMKSGIGPEKVLKAANIPIKVPLESVGRNLIDHPAVVVPKFAVNDTTFFPQLLSNQMQEVTEQFHEGKGLLTTYWKGGQLFKVSSKSEKKDWPDIFIFHTRPVIIDNVAETANFSVMLGRPKSSGTISLDTEKYKQGVRDDTELALIDFKLLSHPDEMEIMLEGFKLMFDIIEKTETFKRVNMTYVEDPLISCSEYEFKTEEYWRCYIRERVIAWRHIVGSCSMGPESGHSNDSVVDNKFRVRGVQDLRVVDASIIPSVPNTNINAAVIMVAEKGADEIKKYWNNIQK